MVVAAVVAPMMGVTRRRARFRAIAIEAAARGSDLDEDGEKRARIWARFETWDRAARYPWLPFADDPPVPE